jgi:dTDP-4-amino-4,6-dideoxygalactose transaminase
MAGEGGMISTNDAALAARLRRIRSHGESERYHSTELGFNYRMTDITSAIALEQLKRLPEMTAKRRSNAAYYTEHLRGVTLPPAPVEPEASVWNLYTIRVSEGRDALMAHLLEAGIEAGLYYPRTLPEQKLYSDLGYTAEDLPMARRYSREALSLPVHPGLTQADIEQIVAAVNSWTDAQASSTK